MVCDRFNVNRLRILSLICARTCAREHAGHLILHSLTLALSFGCTEVSVLYLISGFINNCSAKEATGGVANEAAAAVKKYRMSTDDVWLALYVMSVRACVRVGDELNLIEREKMPFTTLLDAIGTISCSGRKINERFSLQN